MTAIAQSALIPAPLPSRPAEDRPAGQPGENGEVGEGEFPQGAGSVLGVWTLGLGLLGDSESFSVLFFKNRRNISVYRQNNSKNG